MNHLIDFACFYRGFLIKIGHVRNPVHRPFHHPCRATRGGSGIDGNRGGTDGNHPPARTSDRRTEPCPAWQAVGKTDRGQAIVAPLVRAIMAAGNWRSKTCPSRWPKSRQRREPVPPKRAMGRPNPRRSAYRQSASRAAAHRGNHRARQSDLPLRLRCHAQDR